MADVLDKVLTDEEKKEVKELVSTLLILSKEDRAILLANANAFKIRNEIARAKEESA